MEKQWYVVHTYAGYENKVKTDLERRVASMNMEDKIFRIIVPTQEEIEVKDGQKKTVERKVFPGYVLVEMIMDDDSWYVVRNTPGVTGFVGSHGAGSKPVPLRTDEIRNILFRMGADEPEVRMDLHPGDSVRIVEGPFADFVATVESIDTEHQKVRVVLSMFGRETPMQLSFAQVEKMD
ncbi:MAG: transcription termination/antitermination protein NusG [Firmicutes bacterium]|nr:transcription termination/antitermination protein NusG [Bacillota bacterium]